MSAFRVLVGSFLLIVAAAVVLPDRGYDTGLLLGLGTISLTAALALVGIQLYMNRWGG